MQVQDSELQDCCCVQIEALVRLQLLEQCLLPVNQWNVYSHRD